MAVYNEEVVKEISEHYNAIIRLIGEDPEREGLQKTPCRAARAFLDINRGYSENPDAIIKSAMFDDPRSSMVVVKDIEFYSLCEHHILPFFGHVSIGYIPNGKIVGLSKLARVVDVFACRLQVQERLTHEILEVLNKNLEAKGVIVRCEAQHLCMKMRGVEKQDSVTVTLDYSGEFESPQMRENFFEMLR